MLGAGCPWKSTCKHKASGYEKKIYCNHDKDGWKRCPQRPANYGNSEIQKADSYRKSRRSAENMGGGMLGLFLLACVAAAILKACAPF